MALGFLYGAGGGGGQPEPEIKALIPVMTSNTTPSGICSASSIYNSGSDAFHAFDGNTSATWSSSNSDNNSPYVAYAFPSSVVVKSIQYYNVGSGNAGSYGSKFKFQASNDGNTWVDISEEITQAAGARVSGTINLDSNKTAYTNYRVVATETVSGLAAFEMQLYGYDPNYQPAVFPVIYNHGSWSVGYDNASYTLNGNRIAAQLESSDVNMTASNGLWCAFGTYNKIDLTDYSLLKILATATGSVNAAMGVGQSKEIVGDYTNQTVINSASTPTEFVLDVSALSGEYYIAFWNYSSTVKLYKIWLE